MYIVIRSYDLIAGTREEFIQRVQERLVPLLNHVPGFRAFTLLEAGDNNVTFISTFNKVADAKASARLTKDWHTEHLNVFIRGYTRIAAGQVRVHQAWDID
jgi:heme-degrading monooxygenase HmoA